MPLGNVFISRQLPLAATLNTLCRAPQPFFASQFFVQPRGRRRHPGTANMSSDAIATGIAEKDGKQFRTVQEGKATILVPQGAKVGEDKGEVQQVFYNPIQQFNRDLSVLAIKTYGEEVLGRRRDQYENRSSKKGKKRKLGQEDEENATEQKPEGDGSAAQDQSAKPPYKPPFKILDALSASGLRALRYAHEIPFATSVTANDLSASAAKSIEANVAHNGLGGTINVTNNDALALMYQSIAEDLSNKDRHGSQGKTHKWDVVDLDPYGTGAPFFDAAVQAVRDDGGLLCVTCTDSAVWAGHSYCEKTYALYGGIPVKGSHSHEAGLRLILNAIATSAARYGLDIEPLLSLSIDFYTKIFVRVNRSPQAVKYLGAKTMLVYSCDQGCGAWQTQHLMKSKSAPNKKGSGFFYKHTMAQGPTADPFCPHCGTKSHINGPMYAGRLHSPDFIQRLLDQLPNADTEVYGTLPRIEGMLRTALEEHLAAPESVQKVSPKEDAAAAIDHYPFYVVPSRMAGVISCVSPPLDMFRGALIHLGYQATRSHCRAGSIKTDAPWSTIWWIMMEWIRQKAPIKASNIKPNTAAWRLLNDAGLLAEKEEGQPSNGGEPSAKDEDARMEGIEHQAGTSDTANGNSGEASEGGKGQGLPNGEELRKTLAFNEYLARLGRQHDNTRLVRYQANPEKNWGPLNRAKAH